MDLVNYNGRGSEWRLFLPARPPPGILSGLAACRPEAGLPAPCRSLSRGAVCFWGKAGSQGREAGAGLSLENLFSGNVVSLNTYLYMFMCALSGVGGW